MKTLNTRMKTKQTKNNTTPDEQGSLKVEGHIKIFDPTTKETFVDKRS